jgi:hypothetical protein
MKKHQVRLFGDPISRGGARYFLRDQEDLIAMRVDLGLAMLRLNRISPRGPALKGVVSEARHEQILEGRRISNEGIPDNLKNLLAMSRKADIEKLCKRLTISQWDLFLLIHNCSQLKIRHRSKFPEFVPPHLEITDNDRSRLKEGVGAAFAKKLTSLMRERRNICVHLFERGLEWHCFYFSYRDIETDGNHWSQGAHLHYLSYLWPNITKDKIWKAFDTRVTKLPGDLHIRFEPFSYSPDSGLKGPDSAERLAEITTIGFTMLDVSWRPS